MSEDRPLIYYSTIAELTDRQLEDVPGGRLDAGVGIVLHNLTHVVPPPYIAGTLPRTYIEV